MKTFYLSSSLVIASSFLCTPAMADTIWTTWTTASVGDPGSASGSLGSIAVSYSGEVNGNTNISGTSTDWSNPASSFIGGTVTRSPSTVGDIIAENGSYTGINTLTFSSPIVNPVFAVWSLGEPSLPASYTFNATPTLEAGGTDIYGGSSISVSGNSIDGAEGSGVVQFTGTFTSISWTDTPENYYGFTVGEANTAPEPAPIGLLACGITGLWFVRKRALVG